MKIRTTFVISTVLFGVILLMIAASAIITNRQVAQTSRQEAIAKNLNQEANELSYLSTAYLLYHEGQQLSRWESKYDSFSNDLASLNPNTPEQRALVDNIRANQERLRSVFTEVRSTIEDMPRASGNVFDPAFVQVSWSRMEVQNQGMIFDASRLAQMLRDQENQLRQTNSTIIFALIGIFGAFLLSNYFLTYQRTLKSISELQTGTEIIGSGNLDFTISERGKDEIGDLSRAFNQMTTNLKDVTASKADLEREIDERKKAEGALRESEENYRRIVETSTEGIWVTQADGKTLFVNQRMAEMLGYSREEMLGRVGVGFLDEDEKAAVPRTRAELQGGQRIEHELKLRRKDGEVLWTIVSASPLTDRQGQHIGNLSMHTDITERKRAEQERESLLAEVRRRAVELNAANEELEAFTYSVSHDLRAPLRHIDGFSKILLQDYSNKLDERGREFLQFVGEGSRKMGELIDALLGLSRVARTEMRRQPVNLSELAESILAELHTEQPERQVHLTITPDMVTNGDPQLLRILLENLFGNAWKFTSKRPVAEITFGLSYGDSNPIYLVKDNGAGFDMAYADKLFGAFQRLHGPEEFLGTGIGLATVQRIINRHGGRVWAEGAIDNGATFYFTLE